MPNRAGWVLFVREGCHLCEDARVLLDEMIGRDAYSALDIEADDELLRRYAHRIPVLAVDGSDRLELVITRPDVVELLRDGQRPA
jgi:hypothetical protein